MPLPLVLVAARHHLDRWVLGTLLAVAIVAVIYTAPWDNLIIVNGVWSYGPHQILGTLIGYVPLEEYIFYVLQVLLVGLLTVALAAYWRR